MGGRGDSVNISRGKGVEGALRIVPVALLLEKQGDGTEGNELRGREGISTIRTRLKRR